MGGGAARARGLPLSGSRSAAARLRCCRCRPCGRPRARQQPAKVWGHSKRAPAKRAAPASRRMALTAAWCVAKPSCARTSSARPGAIWRAGARARAPRPAACYLQEQQQQRLQQQQRRAAARGMRPGAARGQTSSPKFVSHLMLNWHQDKAVCELGRGG